MAGTALVVSLLLAGTVWGQDDHFPFGPFRMYSTRNEPNGPVSKIIFRATTTSGDRLRLRSSSFGLRPAEVDGQIRRFRQGPGLVVHLVTAYERLNPDAPPLQEFEIVYGIHELENGRPTEYRETVIAAWTR